MPRVTLSLPLALGLVALFLGIGAGVVFLTIQQQPEIIVPPTPTPIPTITITPTPSATPETPPQTITPIPTTTPVTYIVQEGDTCISIAFAFDVSVNSIVLLNNLPAACDSVFIGQPLLIPHPTPTGTPLPTATLSAAEATRQSCDKINYQVQANDTLSTIAANYNVLIDAIKHWNGLVSNTIRVGQQLVVPLCEQIYIGPTFTPTVSPPYLAPNLLLPPDGASFTLADDTIILQWASVGTLRENEAYEVTIKDVTDPEGRKLVDFVLDTKFIIPASFRPASNTPHLIRWWVTPVRLVGNDEDGLPIYEPAGAVSTPRAFTWVVVVPGTEPTP